MPALLAQRGDPWLGMDREARSLEPLLDLSARQLAEHGEAPMPPQHPRERDEPPRVQPSRRRAPDEPEAPDDGDQPALFR